MNMHFAKEDIQMKQKHMKKCSISFVTRKVQIKSRGEITSYPHDS